ncbi:monosaccharide ABC transporter substrate-binding protein (CUT2 family) [Kineothrix alysoides]|uniref:Monosaccharide ABC transporter substrate-binding protein (CUT2 family) n=1 Tax=Kineothrix alysoides TaxID=1469948 RepID=A0A4R1QW45_9FIRM|nr:ABC transporter substrate-binding protein [Kineothrix alysoides]TCL56925.1 monosaccharide ABC transporter substrate-binding protein (CUT2 family) [Kineothrix alysoides]
MKKKLLSVILATAMVATMVGCGSATSEPAAAPAAEEAAPAKEAAPAEEVAEEPAAEEASDDLIVVGYAQVGAESDWRTANTESFKTTFTEENGYQLIFDDAQQKQENQIKAIRSFIQQEVDYIVVAPVVETGWETVLEEAKEAGIPVILSDRMMDVSDDSLYECWVGGNFVKEGSDAAAWLKTYLEGQGKGEEEINIVTLQGTIGASAQVGRTDGFASGMQDNWVMLDKQTGEFTQSKGQEVMESFLKKYPDIDVVVCENDNMAFGAIDAIKAAGKTCGPEGDITIISFDAVAAAFDSMIAGDMNADFECNPLHGPRVAEIIQKLQAGESVEKIQYVDEAYFDTSMDVAAIKETRAY